MKFAPFILIVIMVGALVGWFAPGASDSGIAPATEAPQDEASSPEPAQRGAWGGEVVLTRAGDGHFYADVVVDAVSAHMLVDTGASAVALTGEDAEAMGIRWNQQDVEPVARGASGEVYGVRVTIDRMQLGDLEARGVEAVVIPEGLAISLLGQSFLAQIPRVEIEQQTMVLGG